MTPTPPSSRRLWPWLLALLLLAGLGGLLALKQAFPPARIAALVGEQVRSAIGREFSIQGRLSWRVFPSIAVVVEDVRLANLPWGTRADMVSMRKAALELALRPFTQKGPGVSAANLSGLAKLEGPLNKPRLSLDVAGSAREATQLGLKIATGGLSVLAQRTLLKPEPGERPCQRALKSIASSSNSTSKSVLNTLFGH